MSGFSNIGGGLGLGGSLGLGGNAESSERGQNKSITSTNNSSRPTETGEAEPTATSDSGPDVTRKPTSSDDEPNTSATADVQLSSTQSPSASSPDTTSNVESSTSVSSTLTPSATSSPGTTFQVGGQPASETTFTTSILTTSTTSSLTESIASSLGLSSSESIVLSTAPFPLPTMEATSSSIFSTTPASSSAKSSTTPAVGDGNLITQSQITGNTSTPGLSTVAIAGIAGGVGGAVFILTLLFVLRRVWRKRRQGNEEAIDKLDEVYHTGRSEGFDSTDKLVRWNKGLSEYHRSDTSQAYKGYRM